MQSTLEFLLHLDTHLAVFTHTYGIWVYALIFIVIFAETGLVVTPFLPGDTLLFIAGALSTAGVLSMPWTAVIIAIAAILGNLSNYAIGRVVGPRAFNLNSRWLNRRHLERTHEFFTRHGGKTIVLARFLPIIRTFAPFVAGIASMSVRRFTIYTVIGCLGWVGLVYFGGVFFGTLPIIQHHLTEVILGIVIVSLVPAALAGLFHRSQTRHEHSD